MCLGRCWQRGVWAAPLPVEVADHIAMHKGKNGSEEAVCLVMDVVVVW